MKNKLFFYVLFSLTLILEIILIILLLKGDINSKSFLLIGVSNLLTMILSIFNIRKASVLRCFSYIFCLGSMAKKTLITARWFVLSKQF